MVGIKLFFVDGAPGFQARVQGSSVFGGRKDMRKSAVSVFFFASFVVRVTISRITRDPDCLRNFLWRATLPDRRKGRNLDDSDVPCRKSNCLEPPRPRRVTLSDNIRGVSWNVICEVVKAEPYLHCLANSLDFNSEANCFGRWSGSSIFLPPELCPLLDRNR